jgi:hypothetical protein
LKQAGFMQVTQPRGRSEEGRYFGCRAIRIITSALFEWLGLGPMLRREQIRASEALRRKARKANRKFADFMRRVTSGFKFRVSVPGGGVKSGCGFAFPGRGTPPGEGGRAGGGHRAVWL